jgi:uncharacterized protein (DUF1499 family)
VGLATVACAAVHGAPLLLRRGGTRADWALTSCSCVAVDIEDTRSSPRGSLPSPRRALRRAGLLLRAAVGALCCLLLLVRLCSSGARVHGVFPAACPAHLPDGCARIADVAPHAAGSLTPLHLAVKRRDVVAAATAWAASGAAPTRGKLVADSSPHALLHLRFVSRFWGFADDVLLSLSCTNDAVVRVQAHSQLRLGRGDLGVNAARHAALWAHLAEQLPTRAPDDDALWCTEDDGR